MQIKNIFIFLKMKVKKVSLLVSRKWNEAREAKRTVYVIGTRALKMFLGETYIVRLS